MNSAIDLSYASYASYVLPQQFEEIGIRSSVAKPQENEESGPWQNEAPTTATTIYTTTTVGPCLGNITLFSQTYLRGENTTFLDDVQDLVAENFNDKTTSVDISGTCCWTLFSKPNFQGSDLRLRPGQHKSAADLGNLFREASSVKNVGMC